MYPVTTKILYVDDSPTTLEELKNELTAMGFDNAEPAVDGKEALEKILEAAKKGDPFKLIISDWEMPNLSGIDLLNAVRSNKEIPQAPFIFLTKEADMTNVWKAIDSGVSSYIVKPLAPGVLKKKMEDVFKKFKA